MLSTKSGFCANGTFFTAYVAYNMRKLLRVRSDYTL